MVKLKLKKSDRIIYLIALFTISGYSAVAQPGINGPGCIIPGTVYEYRITGLRDISSNALLCITGGALRNEDSCISLQTSPSTVLVIWNDDVVERKISVTSALGNASLIVTGTTELNGGAVDDSDKAQEFHAGQVSYTFHCRAATGGACSPEYTYQWQSSTNQINWTNIQGATTKDLQFSGAITISTFFRRVTTETHSNIVAYSDSGQLMIVYN